MVQLYLDGNLVAELFDVADDAHMTARAAVEGAQCGDGILQRGAAKGAETFVDEEYVGGERVTQVAHCQS